MLIILVLNVYVWKTMKFYTIVNKTKNVQSLRDP